MGSPFSSVFVAPILYPTRGPTKVEKPSLLSRGGVIDAVGRRLYIVHMKSVTASEARKNWFRLLDEVANGETIAVRRNDKRIILSLEKRRKKAIPNYKGLIAGDDLDNADKWGWDWTPVKGLVPIKRK